MKSSRQLVEQKLDEAGVGPIAKRAFLQQYDRFCAGERGLIPESEIEPVTKPVRLEDLPDIDQKPVRLLEQIAVIRLNGGLGTSMGLDRPKSLVLARKHYTFLDLVALHIIHLRTHYQAPFPSFYLLNSYRTRPDSIRLLLSRYPHLAAPDSLDLVQTWAPRLETTNLAPVRWPENPQLEWCTPGHGDLYVCLAESGLLRKLLARGVSYLFIANCENVAATIDLRIPQFMNRANVDFVMEVTPRSSADTSGGHPCRRKSDGKLVLREPAQCPPEDRPFFEDLHRHPFLNTNNIWIRLEALAQLLAAHDGILPLPIIVEFRPVDPLRPDSPQVIHLETAVGSAISLFDRSAVILVPRDRFVQVKTTADLLAIRSDAYETQADYRVVLSRRRGGLPPVVQLDRRFYATLPQFDRLFPEGPPSLVACDRFEVEGRLLFHNPVICEGRLVRFVNTDSQLHCVTPGVYTSGTFRTFPVHHTS